MKRLFVLLTVAAVALAATACPAPTLASAPNASNTGPGVPCDTLPPWPGGPIADGAVLDGYRFLGGLEITAANVTVENSCIEGNGEAIVYVRPSASTTILYHDLIRRQHSPTADGTCPYPVADTDSSCIGGMGVYAMGGSGPLGIVDSDISDVVQGVNMASDTITVANSYFHDLALISPDNHIDGVISNGGSHHLRIQGNRIEVAHDQTTPIALYEDGYRCGPGITFCPSDDIQVTNNYVAGGGYCMYPALMGTNIVVEDNTFARTLYPNCGRFGAHTGFNSSATGNRWARNVYDDGTPVAA
jgi:hypothetical protein